MGDLNARGDVESLLQQMLSLMLCERHPGLFSSDRWIVDSTLAVLEHESPDLSLVVLAQMDDVQHALGCACPDVLRPAVQSGPACPQAGWQSP